jgi:hypothetical protein
VLLLSPTDVRDEAMKRARAWVGRRTYASDREWARDLLTFAEWFYENALDEICTHAKVAGDRERAQAAWHLGMRVGCWQTA